MNRTNFEMPTSKQEIVGGHFAYGHNNKLNMRYKPQVGARKSKRRTRGSGVAIREVNSRITISMLLGKAGESSNNLYMHYNNS